MLSLHMNRNEYTTALKGERKKCDYEHSLCLLPKGTYTEYFSLINVVNWPLVRGIIFDYFLKRFYLQL